MAPSVHYLKYPQESREGGIVCPTLQMWKLELRGLSWPGRGSAGFGLLALLALMFVHSTTQPLVQSDISFCSQGLTLFIVVHTHTSPCLSPRPLVTCCTHTARHPSELNPSGDQAAPRLRYRTAEHHRRSPAPSLGDLKGLFRPGLFPGKQWNI